MRHDLDAALDQCLAWLREGMDLRSCLERYPEHAAELRPLLEVAVDVVRVRVPASPIEARATGQRRMLAAMAEKRARMARVHPALLFIRQVLWSLVPGRPGRRGPAWQMAAVMLTVVLFASGWLTVAASAGSLPGDVLYPVKLVSQRAQLVLIFDPAKQRLMADQFETAQRQDVQAVLKGRRQAAVEFRGVLQEMEEILWVVGGLPVTLQETTTIVGQPSLGAIVRVQAYSPGDGELVATWLTVEIEATPEPADTGEPSATVEATESPELTETPEPSPTAESTATAEATETPTPDETLEPSATTEPDDTPEAANTSEPDETADDEETPGSAETPDPDDTLEPEDSPEPDHTAEDEGTPEPDETDEDDATPDHGRTPEPDETDEDDATPDHGKTPEPDETDEDRGTPDPDETPDPDGKGEPEATPDDSDTPEPDRTNEPEGTPHPTERPDD